MSSNRDFKGFVEDIRGSMTNTAVMGEDRSEYETDLRERLEAEYIEDCIAEYIEREEEE